MTSYGPSFVGSAGLFGSVETFGLPFASVWYVALLRVSLLDLLVARVRERIEVYPLLT